MRTLFNRTQSPKSKSEVHAHAFYAAMRIKTHLDNALYIRSLLSALMFEHEHELVIAELQLVSGSLWLYIAFLLCIRSFD